VLERYRKIGQEWLSSEVAAWTDNVEHIEPTDFNEVYRYLPSAVTSIPGYISYKVNPYAIEIINNFSIKSPVREVSVMKGAQVTYTTMLESIALYYMFFVRSRSMMFYTAEQDMANARVEACFIPMINQSGFADNIRSGDVGNRRKTGKTKTMIQYDGGGNFLWFGVRNPNKSRMWSAPVILKDEIDGWPIEVADGCPDALTDQRAASYPNERKIFRGSTPALKDTSKIEAAYLRGDQRKYFVRCLKCGFAQYLGWVGENKETGKKWGFTWETQNGTLVPESVFYCCRNCGHPHHEYDKAKLFALENGAEWKPTANAISPNVRSYHLPATYAPVNMRTWVDCVVEYLKAWDPVKKKIIDQGAYQSFRNNILGKTYEVKGAKVRFQQVSLHRRSCYRLGQVPNKYAIQWSGSRILMVTCAVDVHKHFLAVSTVGWTKDARSYQIDYKHLIDDSDEGCENLDSPVWAELAKMIDEHEYTSDDGYKYPLAITVIDSGYQNELVVDFCSQWESGVYPILGRQRPAKNARIQEFSNFKTTLGTIGFKIVVDHYKDRCSTLLRRDWSEEAETQDRFHYNAPIDIPDSALKELTVERRMKKVDEKGHVSFYWHRPDGARNELWDTLIYNHAALEIFAWIMMQETTQAETMDWPGFWTWLEDEQITYTPK